MLRYYVAGSTIINIIPYNNPQISSLRLSELEQCQHHQRNNVCLIHPLFNQAQSFWNENKNGSVEKWNIRIQYFQFTAAAVLYVGVEVDVSSIKSEQIDSSLCSSNGGIAACVRETHNKYPTDKTFSERIA